MTWHGQINRTIWEIGHQIKREPRDFRLRKEYLRTHFLQRYELDRSLHIPRDDRSFLFMQERRAPVCLLLHGENGTPAEMRDLGNYLYSRGLTLYCPRISRYDSKDRLVSWESWVTAAEGALTTVLQYSREAVVIGSSFGGTIALILDELHRIKALTLLAPALYPKLGFKARLFLLAKHIVPNVYFRLAGWDGETTKAMERVRVRKTKVTTPMLALQARNDNVVSGKGLKFLRRIVMNEKTEIVLLPDGAHALTRGNVRNDVFERVYGFLGKIRIVRPQDGPGESAPAGSPQARTSSGPRSPRGHRDRTRVPSLESHNQRTPRDRNAGERDTSERPMRDRQSRRRGGRGRRPRDGRERSATEQTSEGQSPAGQGVDKPAPGEQRDRHARRRSRSRRPRGRSQSDRGADERSTEERLAPGQAEPDTNGALEQSASQDRRAEERRGGDRRDDARSPADRNREPERPDGAPEGDSQDRRVEERRSGERRDGAPSPADRNREPERPDGAPEKGPAREDQPADHGNRDGDGEERTPRDD
ncbi:MAG: hypothetical protein O7D32_01725 [bacterium]|nr:hypothetical protein [bacterium]